MPKVKRQSTDMRRKRKNNYIRNARIHKKNAVHTCSIGLHNEYKECGFKFEEMNDIFEPVSDIQNQNNFIKLIQGSKHQGESLFKYAGLQCTIICLRAIVESFITCFKYWNASTCDEILIDGNNMYEQFIDQNAKTPQTLFVSDLPQQICFRGLCYTFHFRESYTGTIFSEMASPPYESLHSALLKGFKGFNQCLLTCGLCTTTLLKQRNFIAIYDSHSRNSNGLADSNGKSVLVIFKGFSNVVKYLRCLFLSLNLPQTEPFELTPCRVYTKVFNENHNSRLHALYFTEPEQISKTLMTNVNEGELHKCSKLSNARKRKHLQNVDVSFIFNSNEKLKKRKMHKKKRTASKKICNEECKHPSKLKKKSEVSSFLKLINKFKSAVSKGPEYVCSCCQQTWFKDSVKEVKTQEYLKINGTDNYLTGYTSVLNKEWICRTCYNNVKVGKIPVCSVKNKNMFPPIPNELMLSSLEERLISPRIPFMQIRERPKGGQLSIKGNVVNVPCDVVNTVKSLPRTLSDSETIAVKLKRKLSYQHYVHFETIRPSKVFQAAKYLLNSSSLFKDEGICLNSAFLNEVSRKEIQDFVNGKIENTDTTNENTDCVNTQTDEDDDDEQLGPSGNMDTLLQPADNDYSNKTFMFAPGEGNTPLGVFQDKNAEFLAFPTIYCGKVRPDNAERHVPVHYSDICKWELRNVDRRVASCVPNLFFKLKKLQTKQLRDKVFTAIRKIKGQGSKKHTVGELLSPGTLDNLVKLNEGYRILRTIRGSPPYFENMKKDLFALIRQLGIPTFFCSFSAAETRWVPLLQILGKLNDKQTFCRQKIEEMSWSEKCRLIKSDPVTCARYFDYRINKFISDVLLSNVNPVGKICDYFGRIEFQHRGSPHLHILIWIENAPKYGIDSNESVVEFIDKYITCSHEKDIEKLISLQKHHCTKTCRGNQLNKKHAKCRFNFPIPPIRKTKILEPLESDNSQNAIHKSNYETIKAKLQSLTEHDNLSFDDWLKSLELSEEQYINALRSSISEPKPFLRRKTLEVKINSYNKTLIAAWEANLDIQFVTNAYACASYIVSYITKGQRGMSELLQQACNEAKQGNCDIKQQVCCIANKFLGAVEVSAQEAAYLVLQIPLRKSTRNVVFINTTDKYERTFLLKSQSQLEALPQTSTDIESDNIIKKYERRPKALEKLCLADFVSWYTTSNSKKPKTTESSTDFDNLLPEDDIDDNNEDCKDISHETDDDDDHDDTPLEQFSVNSSSRINQGNVKFELKGGAILRKVSKQKVIRYVRFNKTTDSENYFREQIMLFTNWRNEIKLIGNSVSYSEEFLKHKEEITKNRSKYEINADAVDLAELQVETNEYSDIAPCCEYENEIDGSEIQKDSLWHDVYNPGNDPKKKQFDIGPEIGVRVPQVKIEIQKNVMAEEEYLQLVKCLNKKQKRFFYHILHHFDTQEKPIYNFLTGGAGCGKSILTRALYQALIRMFINKVGENPDDVKVLMCAPTGKASYNIKDMDIQTLKKTNDQKYTKSIKVKIIKILTDWKDFTSSTGKKGKFLKMLVADSTGSVQAIAYDEIHGKLLVEGASILIRGYGYRQSIIITRLTKIYSCEPINTDNIEIEETPVSPIKDVSTSPVKSLVTLQGKIIQEEAVKSVSVGQRNARVKEMTMKDETGEVKISLWDEMTETPCKCGDKVCITDGTVKYSKFHNQNTISVGNLASIHVLPSDEVTFKKVTILAVSAIDDTDLEIFVTQNDEEMDYICKKDLLSIYLTEHNEIDISLLPITCQIKVEGKRSKGEKKRKIKIQ